MYLYRLQRKYLLGAISASAGASLNFIWDADTVEDLEKNQTLNVGASLGEGFQLV